MLVNATDLKKLWKEKGPKWTMHHIQEAIAKKEISPSDFSLRDMACNLIDGGREMVDDWYRSYRGGVQVTEAAHAVDTGAFSNITGQLVFSAIQEGMQLDELIGDQLVSIFPSAFQDEEKLPGISAISDEFEDNIIQGEPYPLVGMSEEWVTIPAAEKKGGILPYSSSVPGQSAKDWQSARKSPSWTW